KKSSAGSAPTKPPPSPAKPKASKPPDFGDLRARASALLRDRTLCEPPRALRGRRAEHSFGERKKQGRFFRRPPGTGSRPVPKGVFSGAALALARTRIFCENPRPDFHRPR